LLHQPHRRNTAAHVFRVFSLIALLLADETMPILVIHKMSQFPWFE